MKTETLTRVQKDGILDGASPVHRVRPRLPVLKTKPKRQTDPLATLETVANNIAGIEPTPQPAREEKVHQRPERGFD